VPPFGGPNRAANFTEQSHSCIGPLRDPKGIVSHGAHSKSWPFAPFTIVQAQAPSIVSFWLVGDQMMGPTERPV
jgi:hypothetical protein